MKKINELTLLSIIGVYILTIFAILVGGSVFLVHPIFNTSFEGWNHFTFVFPFVLVGTGIWGIPIAIIHGTFALSSDVLYRTIIFWAGSVISIPITIVLSKGISIWRRVPYIYVISVLIAGTSIWLEPTFGQ